MTYKFTDYKARLIMLMARNCDPHAMAMVFQIEGLHIPFGRLYNDVAPFLGQAGVQESFASFCYNEIGNRIVMDNGVHLSVLVGFDYVEFTIHEMEGE